MKFKVGDTFDFKFYGDDKILRVHSILEIIEITDKFFTFMVNDVYCKNNFWKTNESEQPYLKDVFYSWLNGEDPRKVIKPDPKKYPEYFI